MTTESIIDFENHLEKCRVCLKDFDMEDTQVKITTMVQQRFQDLTSLQLKTSDNYSNVICESCNSELRNISVFRKELIFKQSSLYAFVDGDSLTEVQEQSFEDLVPLIKNEVSDMVEVKTEQVSDPTANFSIYSDYVYEPEDDSHLFTSEEPEYEKPSGKSIKKHYKRALCGLCGNSYYKDQLQRHIDKVHFKVKRFFCDVCGFGSFLKCNLATHMAKHVAKEFREQIHCSMCVATFTRIESLKNHMKTEHEENPEMMTCFCGKSFNLRHKLTTHIKRTHNNRRDHGCETCSKRFFTPKELRVHILKSHTPGFVDKSEHFCEICGKKYSSSKSLRTHMKHHSEPEFKCSFESCNKGFISKLLLANHEKIHLGQRDHQCHLCEKSFFSANHLRRHIAVTHEKVRVNCFVNNCRFSVGRKDYLRNHIILSHRELSEDVKNSYLATIRDMKL